MRHRIFLSALVAAVFSMYASEIHVPQGKIGKAEEHSEAVKTYQFAGTHFFASYKECDSEALCNIEELKKAFTQAVEKSGATILKYDFFDFSQDSTTGTFILSESHASIHTYPEHNACFVDLFTCGDHCFWQPFHKALKAYLQPKVIEKTVVKRN